MIRLAVAVASRPMLWPIAYRQWRRTCRPAWWRHRPFLPVPAPGYVAFRLQTQYGDQAHPIVASDLVRYLEWCRAWDRAR